MYGPVTNLGYVLKMKLRGVPKGPLSSPKSFAILFKGDDIVFAILFWFSRSLNGAREEHTQYCYFQLLVPNVSLDVIKIGVLFRFINQRKPSTWQKANKGN
jgi:hypothetical protein